MRVPKTSTSPDVASRMPASTLSRVVLPHPEGPTSSNNSPVCTLKSTLSSACTSVVPTPNNFVTPRRQAACVPFAVSHPFPLATEHHRRFKLHHFANANQRRQKTDRNHSHKADHHHRPRSRKRNLAVLAARDQSEDASQSCARTIAHTPHQQPLQQNHLRQRRAACAHRLQRAKVTFILQRELIKRLSHNRHAHQKHHQQRNPNADRDPCVLQVVAHRQPAKLLLGIRGQPGRLANPPRYLSQRHA